MSKFKHKNKTKLDGTLIRILSNGGQWKRLHPVLALKKTYISSFWRRFVKEKYH